MVMKFAKSHGHGIPWSMVIGLTSPEKLKYLNKLIIIELLKFILLKFEFKLAKSFNIFKNYLNIYIYIYIYIYINFFILLHSKKIIKITR